MAKLDRNSTRPEENRVTEKPESQGSWFDKLTKLFKSEDKEKEELTFETKHKKARSIDKKKVTLYTVLGLMVVSSLGAIAMPLISQLKAPEQKQEVQPEKTLDNALKLKENKNTIETRKPGEDIGDEKKSDEEKKDEKDIKPGDQDAINKKVQEELDKATAKVVEEYNKKLAEATARVQSNNVEVANLKAENQTLQKQIEDLKKQLENKQPKNNQSEIDGNDGRLKLPGQ